MQKKTKTTVIIAVSVTLAAVISVAAVVCCQKAGLLSRGSTGSGQGGSGNTPGSTGITKDILLREREKIKEAEPYDQTVYSISGWEISQPEPTPEELAGQGDKTPGRWDELPIGTYFRPDCETKDVGGKSVLEKSNLECYHDGELKWTAEVTDFMPFGYADYPEGIAAWGTDYESTFGYNHYSWFAIMDHDGHVKWQKKLDLGYSIEQAHMVVSGGDGTWAVFGMCSKLRGPTQHFFCNRFDPNGNELSTTMFDLNRFNVQNGLPSPEGFLLSLRDPERYEEGSLLGRFDPEGNLIDCLLYRENDYDYHISDMLMVEGKLYLSGYFYPTVDDVEGKSEFGEILDYIAEWCESEGLQGSMYTAEVPPFEIIPSEVLTPKIREHYTAVLLVCDPETFAPENFYTVPGSLGSKLALNDAGRLTWNVESVSYSFFSPQTDSFILGGNSGVYQYTFDEKGTLIDRNDTGYYVEFRR